MAGLLPGSEQLIADQPLVSFKAGKMTKEGSTVTADPRRGTLRLVISPEDSFTHLQWRPRGSGSNLAEEDLIIIPGVADFVRVNSTPDRVYILKWRDSDARMFFWMQDPDPSTDQANVDAINRILSVDLSQESAAADEADAPMEQAREEEEHVLEAAHESLTGGNKASGVGATTDGQGPARSEPITLDGLQQAMAGIASTGSGTAQRVTPLLTDLLHPDILGPILEQPSMAAHLPELQALLPMCDQRDPSSLSEVLNCPSFRSQAAALTNAFASGNTAELLASFGMPEDSAASAGVIGAAGIQAFLRSLRNIRPEGRHGN